MGEDTLSKVSGSIVNVKKSGTFYVTNTLRKNQGIILFTSASRTISTATKPTKEMKDLGNNDNFQTPRKEIQEGH